MTAHQRLRTAVLGYDDYLMTGTQVAAAIDRDGLPALLDTLATMISPLLRRCSKHPGFGAENTGT